MSNTKLLKLSCILIGEDYMAVSKESIKSQQKISTLASVLLMITLVWGLNGFLLSRNIFAASFPISIFVSAVFMTIIFILEKSIILMCSANKWLKGLRYTLAVLCAIVGSFVIDEIVFKADIQQQLQMDLQEEYNLMAKSDPNIISIENMLSKDSLRYESKGKEIFKLKNEINQESRTGVGR